MVCTHYERCCSGAPNQNIKNYCCGVEPNMHPYRKEGSALRSGVFPACSKLSGRRKQLKGPRNACKGLLALPPGDV